MTTDTCLLLTAAPHIARKPADIPKTQDRINGIDRLVDTDNRQDTPRIAKENRAHAHAHIINISIENARVRPAHIAIHGTIADINMRSHGKHTAKSVVDGSVFMAVYPVHTWKSTEK